jgi:alginate O-acetyltransferase complex protein AlgJ
MKCSARLAVLCVFITSTYVAAPAGAEPAAETVTVAETVCVNEAAVLTPPLADPKSVADFLADCAAKAKTAEKSYNIAVAGRDGWLFFTPELHHVGAGRFWGDAAPGASRALEPENADPLPAILDFKDQLDKVGIELLLVPVPPKAMIYADMASAKVKSSDGTRLRFDKYHHEFYDLLRKNGIDVLDMTTEFLAARAGGGAPLYCQTDTHWSGRACVLTARRIAQLVRDRPSLAAVPKSKFREEWKRIPILGDLTPIREGQAPTYETLPLRFVSDDGASKYDPYPAQNEGSPIVLLGDSHDLVFSIGEDMHTKGAGLPEQLAYEIGIAVDLKAVRGSGATPARTLMLQAARKDASYLAGKKLVIWCFSAREFTESIGWQKVPVVR